MNGLQPTSDTPLPQGKPPTQPSTSAHVTPPNLPLPPPPPTQTGAPSLSGQVASKNPANTDKTQQIANQQIAPTKSKIAQLEDTLTKGGEAKPNSRALQNLLKSMDRNARLSDKSTPLQACLEIRDAKLRKELVNVCLEKELGDLSEPYPNTTLTGFDKILLWDEPELFSLIKAWKGDPPWNKLRYPIRPKIALQLLLEARYPPSAPFLQKALKNPALLRHPPGTQDFIIEMILRGGIPVDLDDGMIKQISYAIAPDKKLAHLLLDKMKFRNCDNYLGLQPFTGASILYTALRESVGRIESPSIKQQVEDIILPDLHGLITDQLKAQNPEQDNPNKHLEDRIKQLEIGKRILVSVRVTGHATYLLIEKKSSSEVTLTHYNTGYGLEAHQKLGRKFQTYRQYEKVPISQLTQEAWNTLFAFKNPEEMDLLNQHINNVLAKGIQPTISNDPADYEDEQGGGSCVIQGLMAYLRHQVMENYPGTKEEKLAAYKWLKAVMLTHVAEQFAPYAHDDVREVLPYPVARQEAELELTRIANSDEYSKRAFTHWNGLEPRKKSLPDDPVARYAYFRSLSKDHSSKWMALGKGKEDLKSQESSEKRKEYDPLSVPYREHWLEKYIRRTQYLWQLNEKLDPDKRKTIVPSRIVKVVKEGHEEEAVLRLLKPQLDPYQQLLFSTLEKLKDEAPDRIPALRQAFVDAGREAEVKELF